MEQNSDSFLPNIAMSEMNELAVLTSITYLCPNTSDIVPRGRNNPIKLLCSKVRYFNLIYFSNRNPIG
jgi:hypothetical protein